MDKIKHCSHPKCLPTFTYCKSHKLLLNNNTFAGDKFFIYPSFTTDLLSFTHHLPFFVTSSMIVLPSVNPLFNHHLPIYPSLTHIFPGFILHQPHCFIHQICFNHHDFSCLILHEIAMKECHEIQLNHNMFHETIKFP